MKTLLDNTGLHSAFRSFEGKARGESDIKDFLQFLTFLVFSDKLFINGFEISPIASKTKEIKEKLVDLGLETYTLQIIPFTENEYFRICEDVAKAVSKDLEISFRPIEKETFGMQPDVPRNVVDNKFLFHSLITKEHSKTEINKLIIKAREDMSSNIGIYMLVKNEELLKKAKTLAQQSSKWTINSSSMFNIYLRNLHNDFLARKIGAKYGPATDRAKVMRKNSIEIIKRVENTVDDAVIKLKNSSLGIPAVSQALIELGKGEVIPILLEALLMREKVSKFHNWINNVAVKMSSKSFNERFEAEKEINDLSNDLQKTLGIQAEPEFLDALDLNFVLGIPSPKLSLSKLIEWINYSIKKREIAVLTNLSTVSALSTGNTDNQDKFEKNCIQNIK